MFHKTAEQHLPEQVKQVDASYKTNLCEALEIFCGTWLDFQHVQTFFLLFKNNLLCLLYIYQAL